MVWVGVQEGYAAGVVILFDGTERFFLEGCELMLVLLDCKDRGGLGIGV